MEATNIGFVVDVFAGKVLAFVVVVVDTVLVNILILNIIDIRNEAEALMNASIFPKCSLFCAEFRNKKKVFTPCHKSPVNSPHSLTLFPHQIKTIGTIP
jgi:hypothetical protein